jgi:hypothetical protein
MLKIAPDGTVAWARSFLNLENVSIANANFAWTPYRFTEPYLYAMASQGAAGKLFSILFALDYANGEVKRQVKFTSPGVALYTDKANDSLYLSLLDINDASRASSQGFLLRLDFDLNVRAARSIRNAEVHWPQLHVQPSGRAVCSYSYRQGKMLVAEGLDANLEGANACEILPKAELSVTKADFQSRSVQVTPTPLLGVTVADTKGKVSEADITLVPFDLRSELCGAAGR